MALTDAGLLLPTLFFYLHSPDEPNAARRVENLSEEIATILIATYGLSLLFALKTHAHRYRDSGPNAAQEATRVNVREGHWSVRMSLCAMLGTTIAAAFFS